MKRGELFSLVPLLGIGLTLAGGALWITSLFPIVQHLRSESWIQGTGFLDTIDVAEHAPVESITSGRTKTSLPTYRVGLRYRYSWNGRDYTGERASFFQYFDGSLDGKTGWDGWRPKILNHAGGPREQGFSIWINPKNPSESVVIRDVRWAAFAAHFLWASFLFFLGLGILGKGLGWQLPRPPEVSATAIAFLTLYALPLLPIAGLLIRESRYVAALIALLPALIAVNGWRRLFF